MGLIKKLAVVAAFGGAAALQSTSALAAMQVWDFDNDQHFSGSGNGNTLQLSSGGVALTVSGWSNTDDVSGPDRIEDARLHWAQSTALGIINRDEGNDSPNHSIDSIGDSDGNDDMLMLVFDEPVILRGIDLNWARGGSFNNTADVSILAYDGSGGTGIAGDTWGEVLSSNGGNYDSAGNYANVGLNYYAVNPTEIASTTWLIGAYNPIFGAGGSGGNDGLKLSWIKTEHPGDDTPPGEVPVPGTVPLMLLGLALLRGGVMARKRNA